jgi:GTP cyclohydrolase II
VNVVNRIPIVAAAHNDNLDYLKTKAKKMAHMLFERKKEHE